MKPARLWPIFPAEERWSPLPGWTGSGSLKRSSCAWLSWIWSSQKVNTTKISLIFQPQNWVSKYGKPSLCLCEDFEDLKGSKSGQLCFSRATPFSHVVCFSINPSLVIIVMVEQVRYDESVCRPGGRQRKKKGLVLVSCTPLTDELEDDETVETPTHVERKKKCRLRASCFCFSWMEESYGMSKEEEKKKNWLFFKINSFSGLKGEMREREREKKIPCGESCCCCSLLIDLIGEFCFFSF